MIETKYNLANGEATAYLSLHPVTETVTSSCRADVSERRLFQKSFPMEEYMLNRRHVVTVTALLTFLLLALPAMAQTTKKYAVFPFKYNGPKKYAYFPKAFQASLSSDLEWLGKVEPAPDSAVENLNVPGTKAAAINVLRSSGLDYCVTGDISILEKEATIQIQAFNAEGSQWEKKGQLPINEIAPWLDEQARNIQGDVFNRPGYGSSEKKTELADTPAAQAPLNADIISATEDRYKADSLNPQFRYQGGTQSEGRWRSQTFRFYTNSMVVGDGDGDGKNEVFLLDKHNVHALRFEEGKLAVLDTFPLPPNRIHVRLEIVDADRDGASEILVGTWKEKKNNEQNVYSGEPFSHILSFKEGKLKPIISDYPGFLGVLTMPPAYTSMMVVQKKGRRHIFDGEVHEAYLKEDTIALGSKVAMPEFGSIYNVAYLPEGFGFRYAVIDDFHKLKIYDQTLERLWSSEMDRYNSSGVGIEFPDVAIGMALSKDDGKIDAFNIPFRMIVASLSEKGKYELLVNKDLSIASQVFDRYNYFSQGEIHSLVWDGVGMTLAWKTRRIKGQVADLALADLNNDGKKQLVVLVNTFPGAVSFQDRKTLILAYDLNL